MKWLSHERNTALRRVLDSTGDIVGTSIDHFQIAIQICKANQQAACFQDPRTFPGGGRLQNVKRGLMGR